MGKGVSLAESDDVLLHPIKANQALLFSGQMLST
jgi:hypothetical protein